MFLGLDQGEFSGDETECALNSVPPKLVCWSFKPTCDYIRNRAFKGAFYLLSCVRLFCSPMDYSPPGSSVHGIVQARIVEWIAIPVSI